MPDDIRKEIFSYLDLCVKKNNYFLVSKLFLKLTNCKKCQPITIFGKKICYYHNQKTVNILSINFSNSISYT